MCCKYGLRCHELPSLDRLQECDLTEESMDGDINIEIGEFFFFFFF